MESSRSTLLAASNVDRLRQGRCQDCRVGSGHGCASGEGRHTACIDPEAIDCDSHLHDQPFGKGLGDTAHATDTGVPVHDPAFGVRDALRAKPHLRRAFPNESLDLPLERHRAHADVLSSVVKRCFADAARRHAATDGPAFVDQHHIDAGVAKRSRCRDPGHACADDEDRWGHASRILRPAVSGKPEHVSVHAAYQRSATIGGWTVSAARGITILGPHRRM